MSYLPKQRLISEKFLVKDIVSRRDKNNNEYFILTLSNKSGVIEGKIWNSVVAFAEYRLGKVIAVDGIVEEWRGVNSLTIESSRITQDDPELMQPQIKTMVFDIECYGKKFEELDEIEQKYLLENLEKGEEDKEVAKSKTGLYSIFGKICAIGIYCPETNSGLVLAISDKKLLQEKENFIYKNFATEMELLTEFWKEVKNYSKYVTYNGDGFDWPYLYIRSGICRVKTSMELKKFDTEKFLDLQNVLKQGRAFRLEILCKAFGIDNPKEEGVSGLHVQELFYKGNYQTIADYVARDAYSTSLLYSIYKDYMKGN